MSKKAKERQGYEDDPEGKVCENCYHYSSDILCEERWNGIQYVDEVNKRCTLGNFAVKKTATCKEWRKGE